MNEFLVKWDPLPIQDPNGRILGYNVYYKSVSYYHSSEKIARINDTNMPRAILPNIPTGDIYQISVAAFTSVGTGLRSYHVYKRKGKYIKLTGKSRSRSVAHWERKFGYFFICIWEILFVTESSVGKYVSFLLTAKAELLEKDISSLESFDSPGLVDSVLKLPKKQVSFLWQCNVGQIVLKIPNK